ncbi:PREDICTED: far upstream element-binding protein 2-like isoform X1 [Lupinus angustifolius]|uniref:far upstream element-binding protein 2-like isoform X1 n=1 Tax=Lupinus angustifolius TaxID=3871 RepID=UPI00092F9B3B|nr:PREDICTED: far upstream element-binding protein 2-like isoform X1 [Lupinus angustifolius]
MAEEEVVEPSVTSPVPSEHKRKVQDLEPKHNADSPVSDDTEIKRPRIDALDSANGHQDEEVGEPVNDTEEDVVSEDAQPMSKDPSEEKVVSEDAQPIYKDPSEETVNEQTGSEVAEPADSKEPLVSEDAALDNAAEEPSRETEEPSKVSTEEDAPSGDKLPDSVDVAPDTVEIPYKQDASSGPDQPTSGTETVPRKIEVPNNKVGVLIGKAGDTIKYLQYNSGAKIQITRDADADPHSATRPVELIGSLESIDKAEKLINAVIAEADAGGSPALVARGISPAQAIVGSEQIQLQVPNEKVGLIIGRGGETIKSLQTKSGARIQLIPQHLPEGDNSKERTVQVTGDKKQIEIAQEMIKEVMSQPIRPSTSGFGQQAYRPPHGPGGPPQWDQRGSHYGPSAAYNHQHRGTYPAQNQPYAPPPYGNYPQHLVPRSNYGSGWEQRPHHSMQGPPPHNGGYDYYGGQRGHLSDAPPSTQHPGSAPPHGAGPSPAQVSYNYGQPQGQDYGHQAPYTQAGHPQQGYGQGYGESKFDNHASTQQLPYGGHVNAQPTYPQVGAQPTYPQAGAQPSYPQAGAQPNYAANQQYGKPPYYGMPSQGQPPQSYGHTRATQLGDIPYQGSAQVQSYSANMATQQPYPYASSAPQQAAYHTYGSAPVAADSYNHPPPASSQVYTQQGYGQPGAQPAASYPQAGPTGYGSDPSSHQGYPEQAAPNNAVYGYQGVPQDQAYNGGSAPAYSVAPSGQPGYVQPAPAQTGYEQPNQQSVAGYAAVQASAPAAYGKTVSPQPAAAAAYPQYDSTQVYGAPR